MTNVHPIVANDGTLDRAPVALRDHATLRGFSSQSKSAAAEQHFPTCQSSAKQQTGSAEPLCNINTNLSLTTTCVVQAAGTPDPNQGSHTRAAWRALASSGPRQYG